MYPNPSMQLNFENENEVKFFTAPFLPFDNFSAHVIYIWEKTFSTAEHAFQWKKFELTNEKVADEILKAKSPWAVKQISNNAKNRRDDWNRVKVSIMEDILRAKFSQNKDACQMLRCTGVKTIVENSPYDSFWGCGADGRGENTLGKILMKIRSELL